MSVDLRKPAKRVLFINTRYKAEELRLVDTAASITELSRSDFMRRVVVDQARKVVLGASELDAA
jgi:uncharacterized protein (DUF1778 family)